jgi:hypothetical protein
MVCNLGKQSDANGTAVDNERCKLLRYNSDFVWEAQLSFAAAVGRERHIRNSLRSSIEYDLVLSGLDFPRVCRCLLISDLVEHS